MLPPLLRSTQTLHLTEVLWLELVSAVQLVTERHKHAVQHTREDARVLITAADSVGLARIGHTIAEEEAVLALQEVLHTNKQAERSKNCCQTGNATRLLII